MGDEGYEIFDDMGNRDQLGIESVPAEFVELKAEMKRGKREHKGRKMLKYYKERKRLK